MRRSTIAIALLSLTVAATAGAAASAKTAAPTVTTAQTTQTTTDPTETTTTPTTTDQSQTPAVLAVTVDDCQGGPKPQARFAVYTASMPSVAGAARMQMRFTLTWRRANRGPWLRIAVPRWGSWQRAEPGVPGFVSSRRIEGLAPLSAYRVRVDFRWLDNRGTVVATRSRTSAPCVVAPPAAPVQTVATTPSYTETRP